MATLPKSYSSLTTSKALIDKHRGADPRSVTTMNAAKKDQAAPPAQVESGGTYRSSGGLKSNLNATAPNTTKTIEPSQGTVLPQSARAGNGDNRFLAGPSTGTVLPQKTIVRPPGYSDTQSARTRDEAAARQSGVRVGGVNIGGEDHRFVEVRRKRELETMVKTRSGDTLDQAKERAVGWIQRMGAEENYSNIVAGLSQGGFYTKEEAARVAKELGYSPNEKEAAAEAGAAASTRVKQERSAKANQVLQEQGPDAAVQFMIDNGASKSYAESHVKWLSTQEGIAWNPVGSSLNPSNTGGTTQISGSVGSSNVGTMEQVLVSGGTAGRTSGAGAGNNVGSSESGLASGGDTGGTVELPVSESAPMTDQEYLDRHNELMADLGRGDISSGQYKHLHGILDRAKQNGGPLPGAESDRDRARASVESTFAADSEAWVGDSVDTPAGKIQIFNRNPDNTGVALGAEFEGVDFDLTDPSTYPPGFAKSLTDMGYDTTEYAMAWADKWLDSIGYSKATPEEKAVLRAVTVYGKQTGQNVYVDDTQGIVDVDGNKVSQDEINSILGKNLTPEQIATLPEYRQKLINESKNKESASTETVVAEKTNEPSEIDKLREVMDQDLKDLQNVGQINADDLIKESRQSFQMQQAKNLRVAMNRMGRAGSSPEAVQGLTQQMQQEGEQQQHQLEEMTRLQTESQNMAAKINAIQTKIQTNAAIWNTLTNRQAQEEALAYQADLQMSMQRMQIQQQQIQSRVDPLQLALGIGTTVVGSVASAFTAGLALPIAAAGAGLLGGARAVNSVYNNGPKYNATVPGKVE